MLGFTPTEGLSGKLTRGQPKFSSVEFKRWFNTFWKSGDPLRLDLFPFRDINLPCTPIARSGMMKGNMIVKNYECANFNVNASKSLLENIKQGAADTYQEGGAGVFSYAENSWFVDAKKIVGASRLGASPARSPTGYAPLAATLAAPLAAPLANVNAVNAPPGFVVDNSYNPQMDNPFGF
jgi:hypothetical protein